MKLKGKTALITGGTSGIGLATARLFAREGANVIVSGLPHEAASDLSFVPCDVRIESDVMSLVGEAIKRLGKLDILVNSAGVYTLQQTDIAMMPSADYDVTMDTNMKGIFLMTKYAIPELAKASGVIINIASILGLKPEKESPIYCASKAAVVMFTKSIALQYAGRVRAEVICPGPVDTPMLHSGFPDPKDYAEYAADNRIATPEEIAAQALRIAVKKPSQR